MTFSTAHTATALILGACLAAYASTARAQTEAVATGTPGGRIHLLPATMETTQVG